MNKILLINGPNLNLLGLRQVKLYGAQTLEEVVQNLKNSLPPSYTLAPFQNNIEGEIVNFLNFEFINSKEGKSKVKGIIINPGAYTHTSIAIRDALEVFQEEGVKIFEVHLTNIFKRENFRHQSYISSIADGVICGLGTFGYEMALKSIFNMDSRFRENDKCQQTLG